MFKGLPFFGTPFALKLARLSLKLAVGLTFVTFFLNYQPTFAFPPIKQAVIHAQTEQIQTVGSESLPFSFQLPHPGYLTTRFSSWHPGIDIPTGFGMPIKPIAEGTVSNTQFNFFGYGMMVEIDHGYGYQSLYAHMNRIYVKDGQKVTKGTILGEVGLTGRTTGPHTHLEVSKNGIKIDPLKILPSVRQAPEPQDFESHASVASSSAAFKGGPTQLPVLGRATAPTSKPTTTATPKPQIPAQPIMVDQLSVQNILTPATKHSFLSL